MAISIGTGVTVVSHLLWVLGMEIEPTEPGLLKSCFKVSIKMPYKGKVQPILAGKGWQQTCEASSHAVSKCQEGEGGKLVPSSCSPFLF